MQLDTKIKPKTFEMEALVEEILQPKPWAIFIKEIISVSLKRDQAFRGYQKFIQTRYSHLSIGQFEITLTEKEKVETKFESFSPEMKIKVRVRVDLSVKSTSKKFLTVTIVPKGA